MAGDRERSEREVNELLDRLLEGRSPEEIMGGGGLLEDLTKRLLGGLEPWVELKVPVGL